MNAKAEAEGALVTLANPHPKRVGPKNKVIDSMVIESFPDNNAHIETAAYIISNLTVQNLRDPTHKGGVAHLMEGKHALQGMRPEEEHRLSADGSTRLAISMGKYGEDELTTLAGNLKNFREDGQLDETFEMAVLRAVQETRDQVRSKSHRFTDRQSQPAVTPEQLNR